MVAMDAFSKISVILFFSILVMFWSRINVGNKIYCSLKIDILCSLQLLFRVKLNGSDTCISNTLYMHVAGPQITVNSVDIYCREQLSRNTHTEVKLPSWEHAYSHIYYIQTRAPFRYVLARWFEKCIQYQQ